MADGEMAIPKSFGDQIRARRIEKGMSQAALAAKVGVTQGAISLIENGVSGSSQKLLAICRVLDMDPPSFLAHDDDARWLEAGQRLRRSDPTRFQIMLGTIESLARAPSASHPDGSPDEGEAEKPKH
jgi:transcriptional regulator with XRE-family HTH domain